MDKEKINKEEEKLFEEAYKNLDKVADELMEKYDKAFKELAK
ncbi:hypothetical protein [Peptoniphilus grossensis]